MKNSLRNNIGFIVFSMVTVLGCRKDTPISEPPVDNPQGCTEIPCDDFPQPPEIGFAYTSEGAQYIAPCFNPNNEDEFIYLRTGVLPNAELVKYSLGTKQETVICNTMHIISQPQWGEQGWIVFTASDWNVWKIFQDGSGLEKITNYECQNPTFVKGGDKFIGMGSHPDISGIYRPIIDLSGNLVDSIKYFFPTEIYTGYPCYTTDSTFHNGYFAYSDHTVPGNARIGFCKLNDNSSITELNSFLYSGDLLDVVVSSQYVIYSEHRGRLRSINLNTGETKVLRFGCDIRYYHHLSITSSGDKLLVQKVISTPYANETAIDTQNEIWLIDLNSCEDIKILGE